jgi:hypothetical protein
VENGTLSEGLFMASSLAAFTNVRGLLSIAAPFGMDGAASLGHQYFTLVTLS